MNDLLGITMKLLFLKALFDLSSYFYFILSPLQAYVA